MTNVSIWLDILNFALTVSPWQLLRGNNFFQLNYVFLLESHLHFDTDPQHEENNWAIVPHSRTLWVPSEFRLLFLLARKAQFTERLQRRSYYSLFLNRWKYLHYGSDKRGAHQSSETQPFYDDVIYGNHFTNKGYYHIVRVSVSNFSVWLSWLLSSGFFLSLKHYQTSLYAPHKRCFLFHLFYIWLHMSKGSIARWRTFSRIYHWRFLFTCKNAIFTSHLEPSHPSFIC